MDSGFYAAVNGARRTTMRLEVLANNLANVNTTGFKQDDITFDSYMTQAGPEQFPLPSDNFLGLRGPGDIPFPYSHPAHYAYSMTYPRADGTTVDLAAGPLRQTDNPLDVAIEGEGFFVLQSPDGGRLLSRDGGFTVSITGELVSRDGLPVLGEGDAPIVVGQGPVEIANDGTVSTPAGPVGRLMRVGVSNEALTKVGDNRYTAPQDQQALLVDAASGAFHQGFLEGSNANTIRGMTQLVETHRAFETYMKMLQALDSLEDKAANDIGRLQG